MNKNQAARYALIGYPLGHTMSPFIHERLFALSGRSAVYEVLEIPPEELPARTGLLSAYEGLNVTIPHKVGIIPLLRELKDRAALYGSVNTVDCRQAAGYNTDVDGFLYALEDAGIPLSGRVVLCGCGGAARMMAFEAALAGAQLTVAVRQSDIPAAEKLLSELMEKTGVQGRLCGIDQIEGPVDLLINATPVGMYPHIQAMPVSDEVLSNTGAVFDAIYNPRETALLRRAAQYGAKTAGGMPMLVYQAVRAHEIWYGADFAREDIRALIQDANAYMQEHFQKG